MLCDMEDQVIQIFSIFPSIDGEVNSFGQGALTTFIRMSGCNLNCPYCDTKYAQSEYSGTPWSIERINRQLQAYGNRKITLTGGEPLRDSESFDILTTWLHLRGYTVSVETNGSYDFTRYMRHVHCFIVDLKPKDIYGVSGDGYLQIVKRMNYLRSQDWIKFVVRDEKDFLKACEAIHYLHTRPGSNDYRCKARLAFSPVHGGSITVPQIINLIHTHIPLVQHRTSINIQLHKLLNLQEDGQVKSQI